MHARGHGRDHADRAEAGGLLRALRLERGVSLAELARLAFYSKGYLSKVENGEKPLTPELARACDQALDTGGRLGGLLAAGRAPGRPRSEDTCPYQGLSSFGPESARWFFGRDEATADVVAQLTERLRRPGPLMVVAPSGAGKSSLLRAGLLPALAGGVLPVEDSRAWPVALLTPGEQPVEELLDQVARVTGGSRRLLGKALREGPGTFAEAVRAAMVSARPNALVLLVDQFEETFTLCHDEDGRGTFVAALLALAGGREQTGEGLPTALVVLGVRADFYDRCLAYPGLAASLRHGHATVGPMNDAQLRDAITGPAGEAGLEVEAGLVEVMLRDVGLTPGTSPEAAPPGAGVLPLLSHALLGTWQCRENATLTVAGYQRTGGISGAVAATAERAYGSLPPGQRPVARDILLRLVHVGEDKETGRRVRRASLLEGGAPEREAAEAVLEAFTRARLVTVDAEHVEPAHEVLLRVWPRMRRWLDDDRAGLRARQLLMETAAEWEREDRDTSLLYRGNRLASVREWLADTRHTAALGPLARAFLEASTGLEAAERQAERRRVRRLRQLAVGLATLLVLSLIAGGIAVQQSRTARQQRHIAASRELAARADVVAAERPEAAMLLALGGYRRAPSAEARGSLLSAYAQYGAREFTGHTGRASAVAFSPDGRTLATASGDHSVKLWDASTREVLATLSGHTDHVEGLAFAPDGRTLATASFDGSVKLWDVAARRPVATLLGHRGEAGPVAFSPDGRTLATAGADRTVRLWDVAGRRQLAALTGHTDTVFALAFSPDGRTVASAGADRTARLWDVATRRTRAVLTGHTDMLMGLAFAPDGRTLATAGYDNSVRLWDVATRRQTAVLSGLTKAASGVAFSPDGRTLATTGYDRTVRLWDVTDMTHPRQTAALDTGAGDDVGTAVAFSPDGRTLAGTNSGVAFADLWDVSTHERIGTLSGAPVPGTVTRFSPDGRTLATADADGRVRLRDARSLRTTATLTVGTAAVRGLAFAPDGRRLATADDAGAVRLWDLATGRPTATLTGHTDAVQAVAYSPDGRTLATAGADATARLWDVATHRQIAVLTGHTRLVADVAFSPDGRTLATASHDDTARLWDTGTHRARATLTGHTSAVGAVAFSPDGRTLATASKDRTARLWDLATHRQTGTLTGHTNGVNGAAFAPDGRTLATTGADRTIRLWDVAAQRPATLLTARTSESSPAFSPDGRTLATASAENTTRLWSLDPDEVADRVCGLDDGHRWSQLIPELPRPRPCG
ncbi:helix-turn-helix domain-containing protein [Streptomyces sp. UNOB3_S3]|uniref:nSTAND1 domain-containing NTPase n=1 Tax=Streptomyces sp. UNOB3_S3 TaxID=2871682 RepID=UPI001E44962E|nr:helix-turn-helix domain-containing protein [Streptomyces sp. UNOB3_S3]MCC3773684.1 helix-turn-helix domain-containing protein [Streptomyces sp. UNOB3_S3]